MIQKAFSTRLFLTAVAALLPLGASAGTLIIPAVGTGPGAFGSQWKTEVKLHVSGTAAVDTKLQFHQEKQVYEDSSFSYYLRVQPSTTVTIDDVVNTRFVTVTGTGALEILVPDEKASRRLAVTSRTYNTLANGDQLGQDVPALRLDEAAVEGDFVILPGPSKAARTRFNFGIYSVKASRVTWDLFHADGRPVTSRAFTYSAGQHAQYNTGIQTMFGETPQNGDTVRAVIEAGSAIVYGSAIDQSGDPTFIPGMRTRERFDLILLGIDMDEDGSVDIPDLNNDGVLDRPLDVVTSLFPASVRVVVSTEFGNAVGRGLEILSSTSDAEFVDTKGTLVIGATGDLKGKTGQIRVRAHDQTSTEEFVIPIRFL
jgi:hypothetical protein